MKQQTSEWHEMRKNHIGSSDAPVIMGVSPNKTPYKLYLEKLGLGEDTYVNQAMRHGLLMEEPARKELEAITDLWFFPTVIIHPEHHFMMASMDGLTVDRRFACELKCPFTEDSEDHICAMDGVVPEKYYPQVQHQLECNKTLDFIYYFSYTKQSQKIIEVERDQEYIDKLVDKEIEFWRCVQELDAPPLTDRDHNARHDDAWLAKVSEVIRAKEYADRYEELKKELIEMSGGSSSVGGGIKLTKYVRQGNVDYKGIPQLKGVDLDLYRKPASVQWRLTDG